jgi:hypothetical protein
MSLTTVLTAAIPTLAALWLLIELARPARPRPAARRCRHCGSPDCPTPDQCDGYPTAAHDAGLHDPNSGWHELATPPGQCPDDPRELTR